METTTTISRDTVVRHQQDLVSALEYRKVPRKLICEAVGCAEGTIKRLMSSEPIPLSAEKGERLRLLALEHGVKDSYERFLPHDMCLSEIPLVPFDDSTEDELLDGIELLGRVRTESVAGNWEAIRALSTFGRSIMWRLEVHALHKLGRAPVISLSHRDPNQIEIAFSGDGYGAVG